jgi:hypothetical protein
MTKIKITATIADEYMTRGVYDFIDQAGTYHLTQEQATELLEDAKHNVFDVDMMPAGTSRAYAALASNLMAALETAA